MYILLYSSLIAALTTSFVFTNSTFGFSSNSIITSLLFLSFLCYCFHCLKSPVPSLVTKQTPRLCEGGHQRRCCHHFKFPSVPRTCSSNPSHRILGECTTTAAAQLRCSTYLLGTSCGEDLIELAPPFICIDAFNQLVFNACRLCFRTSKMLLHH